MKLLHDLWRDEAGAVLTAELVLLGTLGVVGLTVGANMLRTSINGELKDLAYSIRSLDQSYSIRGVRSCGAYTAGSCYVQEPVAKSLADLCAIEETSINPEGSPTIVPHDEVPAAAPKDEKPTDKPAAAADPAAEAPTREA